MKSDDIKEKLKQYNDVTMEILKLENKIKKLEDKGIVGDIVEGSSKFFPYTKFHYTIKAQNEKIVKKTDNLKFNLKMRLNDLVDLKKEIEDFISSLPTSRMRRIFELRYIQNYTWRKVAYAIGGTSTADSVRKEHDRFFKKN